MKTKRKILYFLLSLVFVFFLVLYGWFVDEKRYSSNRNFDLFLSQIYGRVFGWNYPKGKNYLSAQDTNLGSCIEGDYPQMVFILNR